jgi:uncharacterized RDD family membrane protein YckC
MPLADLGVRASAWIVDCLLIFAGVLVLALAFGAVQAMSLSATLDGALSAVLFLTLSVVRSFYFVFFELRWQGRTPGKRQQKVRVIAKDGGPLSVEMVFARNLTREVEVFFPLVVLFSPEALAPDAGPGVRVACLCWAVVMLSLPFLNHRRARLGDLVAGTLVVAEPVAVLEEDLSHEPLVGRGPAAAPTFTREQLELYGKRELQVLEEALRREPGDQKDELLSEIAERIRHKIGWPQDAPYLSPREFLFAFYKAQRAHLEQNLLLGSVRESKVEYRLGEDGTRFR